MGALQRAAPAFASLPLRTPQIHKQIQPIFTRCDDVDTPAVEDIGDGEVNAAALPLARDYRVIQTVVRESIVALDPRIAE